MTIRMKDYDAMYKRGFGITMHGRFFSTTSNQVHEIAEDIHQAFVEHLTEQANDGDELATIALAEAMRRRIVVGSPER